MVSEAFNPAFGMVSVELTATLPGIFVLLSGA
jgi:hypothetical protein